MQAARGGVNHYASPTVQALDDNPDSQGIKAVQDGTSAYYVISRQSKHCVSASAKSGSGNVISKLPDGGDFTGLDGS
jgi:hypothetical protein